jgi:2-methylcitrate synthase
MCYWYNYSHFGVKVAINTNPADNIATAFLKMLHPSVPVPNPIHVDVVNASLVLYAEHDFNASTFAARVVGSTLSDTYSCIAAAIGALRGPLHGGANEAVMHMIGDFTSVEQGQV